MLPMVAELATIRDPTMTVTLPAQCVLQKRSLRPSWIWRLVLAVAEMTPGEPSAATVFWLAVVPWVGPAE